tara:strand:- start:220 stop:333 length:114 start_codon:yes stop_codon:yes gene_type:complete
MRAMVKMMARMIAMTTVMLNLRLKQLFLGHHRRLQQQ